MSAILGQRPTDTQCRSGLVLVVLEPPATLAPAGALGVRRPYRQAIGGGHWTRTQPGEHGRRHRPAVQRADCLFIGPVPAPAFDGTAAVANGAVGFGAGRLTLNVSEGCAGSTSWGTSWEVSDGDSRRAGRTYPQRERALRLDRAVAPPARVFGP
ncbi:hypothetical protein BN12_10033 [Nostocoides japonicum T1-X7]|uniref:Uncharacterized protein n=1 Tax=Nostocoides japonicum T1-X7 TaxID=1194083 RepID=A0A077LSR7_9MICO|nr:hypothetical protein BN12_10033 [Tetrasphaera japonica T1-X7]